MTAPYTVPESPLDLLPSEPNHDPILMAWSGGKDSTLALATLLARPEVQVVGLLTTVTDGYERITMHGVRLELLRRQALSLGLPLSLVRIPARASDSDYGTRMRVVMEEARARGIRKVAFGDLHLRDVRDYREAMLAKVEMEGVFPIWGRDPRELAEEFIDSGFRAILTCVDSDQIDGEFAGRMYDRALLADLPAEVCPCGENGEFHTFVCDGPIFSTPVSWIAGATVRRDERFVFADLLPGEI